MVRNQMAKACNVVVQHNSNSADRSNPMQSDPQHHADIARMQCAKKN